MTCPLGGTLSFKALLRNTLPTDEFFENISA